MRRATALLGAAALAAGCGSASAGSPAASERGVERIGAGPALAFHERAAAFYANLEKRRFNSLVTYRDPGLREYFQSEQAFLDYYADLAHALAATHFERNLPLEARVLEFRLDAPGRALVRVRIRGENSRPLRWWSTEFVREDRWERRDGRWWIVPGRL